jgi:hypothetical protein
MIRAGYVARMRDRNTYRILAGKFEEKTSLGRSRRTRKYNIRMDLKEIGRGDVD